MTLEEFKKIYPDVEHEEYVLSSEFHKPIEYFDPLKFFNRKE